MAPQDATAAFGREMYEAAAGVVVREVAQRLAHKETCCGHGNCLPEGLWKDST